MRNIPEWQNVKFETFHNEIVPENKPAVLKSLVASWPAVKEGLTSPTAICKYISQFDNGTPVDALVGRPEINGRFFYQDNLQGFNFKQGSQSVSEILAHLLSFVDKQSPPSIAIQAASIPDVLPKFAEGNVLPLLEKSVTPKIWVGNKAMIATHFDFQDNIACVVAGRRRFTLFPPDQIANLYIGPLSTTPAGAPISMVDLRQPDLSLYPRFAQALEAAEEAYLEPGDALYIPYLWWHNVESLADINVLVNYWWNECAESATAYQCLLHSLLTIPKLPPNQREIWRSFFDYFVFRVDHDPTAHLPADLQDIIGTLPLERKQELQALLAGQLSSQA